VTVAAAGVRRHGRKSQAAVRLASAKHLHPPSALLGRRARRRTHAHGHAAARRAGRQHHHRPPFAVETQFSPIAPPANI
jgi:hypothetical protein